MNSIIETIIASPFLITTGIMLLLLLIAFSTFSYLSLKKKEKKLKTANDWLHLLLNNMPDMVFIFDNTHTILNIINPQEELLHGSDPIQLWGASLLDTKSIDPDFAPAVRVINENIKKTIQTGKGHIFEYEITTYGNTCYSEGRTIPFVDGQVLLFIRDITSSVDAEKKTKDLKSFFQAVVDNLPVGLLVKDVANDYRFVFFNNYLIDFYNDDAVPFVLGQNEVDRGDPMAETFMEEDRKVIETDTPIVFDHIYYNPKTGEPEKWQMTTKKRFVDDAGKEYLMAATVETTESKKKDFELLKMQKEMTLAMEAGNVSAWYFDVSTKLFHTIYGTTLSGGGMNYDSFISMVHNDYKEKIKQAFKDVISGKIEKTKQIIRIDSDGITQWYEAYAIGIKSDKDGSVYQIIGTERNITENIEKQRRLEDAQSKLELAFSSAEIIQWEIDFKTRRFSSINPDAIEAGSPMIDELFDMIHPDDRRIFDEGFETIINGKKEKMLVEVRITLPGMEQRWFEVLALVSERDEHGRTSKILGIRRDITAVKMTDELIELRDKAEHSNRLKSSFLANMSHEIRTPLNAIVGFSQLLMQSDDPDEQESYGEIIETNNNLLLQLISDILDLSKIESDELDFIFSEFNVAEIFLQLEQVYQLRIKDGVKLMLDLPEQNCKVLSERNRVTQVISSFLSNAVKFTTKGSIVMGYSYVDNGLRFFVRDTGIGIHPDNIPNVFDRFAKFNSFAQGSGLGLSISEYIVKYLHGEIGIDSELNKGSEFWFTIPVEPIFD